jgi:hypothetical protein
MLAVPREPSLLLADEPLKVPTSAMTLITATYPMVA